MPERQWRIKTDSVSQQAHEIASQHALAPTVAQILVDKQNDDSLDHFLNPRLQHLPDPSLLRGLKRAAERIADDILGKRNICIFGDYDVDGISSAALLNQFFSELGVTVFTTVPDRMTEGYGLNIKSLQRLADRTIDTLITVDNGIAATEAVAYANQQGIDVIITDHHDLPPILPEAYAIVNPKHPDCKFPFKGLAGVGIAFYVAAAVRKLLIARAYFKHKQPPDLKHLLGMVALGTIADQAPLTGVNRILTRHGLHALTRSTNPGLRALIEVSACTQAITSYDVGFRLGPRINAIGRLGSAQTALDLFATDDDKQAQQLAKILDRENEKRKSIQAEIVDEAIMMVEKNYPDAAGIVLYAPHWHVGVIGIVASHIVDRFHCPAVILGQTDAGLVKGSARSIPEVNVFEALSCCHNELIQFGGHPMAAGVSVEPANISSFRETFNSSIAKLRKDLQPPILQIDQKIALNEISFSMVRDLEKLSPFGCDNNEPLFCSKGVDVLNCHMLKNNHVKFTFAKNDTTIEGIAFNLGKRIPYQTLSKIQHANIAYHPQVSTWRNRTSLLLKIVDFKPATTLALIVLFSCLFPHQLSADGLSFYDTRSIALMNASSAYALEGSSNDLNPAGAALVPVYRTSAAYTAPGSNQNNYALTITDAKTSKLAASTSFRQLHDSLQADAYSVDVALATYLVPSVLSVGIKGYYLDYRNHETNEKITGFNGSFGAIAHFLSDYTVGLTLHNRIDNSIQSIQKPYMSAGLSGPILSAGRWFLDYHLNNANTVTTEGDETKENKVFLFALEGTIKQKVSVYLGYGTRLIKTVGLFSGGIRYSVDRGSVGYAFQQAGLFFTHNAHSLKVTFDF